MGFSIHRRQRLAASAVAFASALLAHASSTAGPVADTVVAPFGGIIGGPQNPRGGLVQGKDGSLYGVSQNGGDVGLGVIYKVAPDGTVTLLHSFSGKDGNDPEAGLAMGPDGTLYGTTYAGGTGSPACGTVFSLTPANVFTTLHSFACGAGGGNVDSNVVLAPDGFLYGTAGQGPFNDGEVFRLAPDGTQFAITAAFNTSGGNGEAVGSPTGGLMLGQDGRLYGKALGYRGPQGQQGYGAIYGVTTSASGAISIVHGFLDSSMDPPGDAPPARDASGNFYLYGSARNSTMVGVVYRISASGTLSVLHSFNDLSYVCPFGDGSLLLGKDGLLYGVAACAGANGQGYAFSLSTDADNLHVLHDFANDGVDVTQPDSGVIADHKGQGLWSLSSQGGPQGWGGVYQLTAPTLKLKAHPRNVPPGKQVTLTWTSTDTALCTASGAVNWSGPMPSSGSLSFTPTPGANTYILSCSGAGTVTKKVNVTAN